MDLQAVPAAVSGSCDASVSQATAHVKEGPMAQKPQSSQCAAGLARAPMNRRRGHFAFDVFAVARPSTGQRGKGYAYSSKASCQLLPKLLLSDSDHSIPSLPKRERESESESEREREREGEGEGERERERERE